MLDVLVVIGDTEATGVFIGDSEATGVFIGDTEATGVFIGDTEGWLGAINVAIVIVE